MILNALIKYLMELGRQAADAHAVDDGYVNPHRYDVDEFKKVDPALVGYTRTEAFVVDMENAERLACGSDGTVWIAGGKVLGRFRADGALVNRHLATGAVTALSVQHATGVWLGCGRRVVRFDAGANVFSDFADLGEKAYVTSVACNGSYVFAADAGNRTVHRFDMHGKQSGRIGEKDEAAGIPGFIIPSPYFDVRIAADGTVWVANTGRRNLEHYSVDGKRLGAWGMSSFKLTGFCGCCNPAHFVMPPDGGFITAEKGLVRVKKYTGDGKLATVVAPPADFVKGTSYVDVALNADGDVLLLDPVQKTVMTYRRKKD